MEKVLYVDDDEYMLELLESILQGEEIQIFTESDPLKAIRKYRQIKPSALLLDVQMPKMNGLELYKRLLPEIRKNGTIVILFTQLMDEQYLEEALNLGAIDYIVKSQITPSLLKKKLDNMRAYYNSIKQKNPLTLLPGNQRIKSEIEERLKKKENFSVIYVDIDNFKPYNDYYGFVQGDKVILKLAHILEEILPEIGFLGHIGGDDFIVIVPHFEVDDCCHKVITQFELALRDFYKKEDLERGSILTEDRSGVKKEFPFLSLSIAVYDVPSSSAHDLTYMDISNELKKLKQYAKKQNGNYIIHNRRGR